MLRRQVRADVEAYLLEHGAEGVTDEMVARWCGEATKSCLRQMVEVIVDEPASPEALARARERIEKKMGEHPTLRAQEAQTRGTAALAAHVPAAPSPSYIAKHGVQELERLDIFLELNKLFADANLMRESSVRADAGREKVTNPRLFDKSISRRLEIIATSISTQRELWDLQRMETFYNTIIDTIAQTAPDVAQEIQRRLAALNIRIGMT